MSDIWVRLRPKLESLGWTPTTEQPGGLASAHNTMWISASVDDDETRARLLESLEQSIATNVGYRDSGFALPNLEEILFDFRQAIACIRECEDALRREGSK